MEPIPARLNSRPVTILASTGLLLTAAIWGFAFVVVKDSLDYIGAVYMIAFRFTIAALILCCMLFSKLKKLKPEILKHGFITGIFLFLAYLTQTIGCAYTTAGKNAFLTTIYVFLVPLFAWILYKKRPGWYVFAAAALSLAGIGLLALGTGDSGMINIGDVLTLICGVFYALHIIYTSKYSLQGDAPLVLTLLQFITCAFLGWILAPFFDGSFPPETFNPRVISSMMYLGIFSTLVGFSLQNIGTKFVQASLASLFLSFESVFGILFSIIMLHEVITFRMGIGCIFIFLAVVLAETKFQFKKK